MAGRTVLVQGLREDADEDLVTLFCENRRMGGGDVEKVQLLENGAALVTFVDPSVAALFIAKSAVGLQISGMTLRISEAQPSSIVPGIPADPDPNHSLDPDVKPHSDTLQVIATPSLPSDGLLLAYFESSRSGGGDINKLTRQNTEQSATIVFKDPKVIWEVAKKEHKIGTTQLQVFVLESLKELDDVQSCAIEATGIPSHLSQDMVVMLFESKRQMDGDSVDDIFYDQSNGRAVLTYTSPEVALRVSKRQSVILDDHRVQVELLQPMPPPTVVVGAVDPNKLLAKNLPVAFVDAELVDYLKAPSGKDVLKVSRSRNPSVALLVFSGVPDYVACRRHVIMKPFLDRMISVQKVSLCIQIITFPLAPSLSDDVVLLHFESRRHGGGFIKVYTFNRSDGYVIITYEDRSIIDRVVQTQHSIEGHELRVDYYNDDLGPPPEALSSNQAAGNSQGQGPTVAKKQLEVITVPDVVCESDPKKSGIHNEK